MTTDINKKFRFRAFSVYRDVRVFVVELKKLTKKTFPSDERFGLLSQVWRALDSILLNIAEGSDRGTDKDFALFLNRAHTSLNEVVSCMDIALDNKYVSEVQHDLVLRNAAKLVDQLTAFRRRLLKSPSK
jgi:four helix bundle protein